jgi:hypothetical protein
MSEKKEPDKKAEQSNPLDIPEQTMADETVQEEELPELQSGKEIMVDIRNRKEQFFKGIAKTVSSVNDTGEFDVLPKHANFVTLIRGYVIIDKGLPSEKKFDVDSGVLAAKTDEVDVYLDF